MRYNNYHKHTHISNIYSPDSNAKAEDYIKKAIEYGHTSYFTTEHGSFGDIFEARTLCDKYGLRCIAGIEGYIVPNPLEKDKSNYHILIVPKTDKARKKVNVISSRANIEGYYYKPRMFLEDILKLDQDDVFITTACCAGLLRDDISFEQIFMPLLSHFHDNMLLEVQSHDVDIQKEINHKALSLHKELGLRLIAANDSHYIDESGKNDRLELLKGKGIEYGDEDTFILDYPSAEEMIERFKRQGVLSDSDIIDAINNTLLFDDCEEIQLDHEIKMPTIYPELTPRERFELLKKTVYEKLEDVKKIDHITDEELPKYLSGIEYELKTVEDTNEVIHTADYFLFNTKNVDLAVNKYGGVLTRGGRGSCGSFYINRILGMTQLDRFRINLPIFPDRFASTARLLDNRSLPDIDFNIEAQEPFVAASRELLGEHGCYPMYAPGTMQLSEAFRNVCRSKNIPYEEYNEVGKSIEDYENDAKWKPIIEEANKYVGTIVSGSVHPCAHLISDKDILEEYGVIRLGENICVMITSVEADEYKVLKNDYLIVKVWKLIHETFEEIGKPIIPASQLLSEIKDDERVWDLFKNGITCTLNQVDSDNGMAQAKKYKIHSFEDGAHIAAAIRPSFDSWRTQFLNRDPYTTGSAKLDEVLSMTHAYILFQENLMQYFQWLGVTPAESIGLIKKISKKKIKPEDFKKLEERLRTNWLSQTGSMDGFQTTWDMIQSCMAYGFCVSGDTRLIRNGNGKGFNPTIEEMYRIRNDRQYAKETGHLNLHSKYRTYGYGKALSKFDDGIHENNIVDITYTGIRRVFLITTESGRTIKCTENHKFPTPNGEQMCCDLKVGDLLYCVNEDLDIVVDDMKSLQYAGEENVYSVSMADPAHNYAVNDGIITNNCSAHAAATSLDMCYGAYLKVNYPYEYYAVCFNNYIGDQERTNKLTKELAYFGIGLSGIKFRRSRAKYSYNKDEKKIYKGIESIKFMNEKASEELYELKDNHYDSFVDLLVEIEKSTSVNSRQLDILIKLDFFSEFGDANKLLDTVSMFNCLYGKKNIAKKNLDKYHLTEDLCRRYAVKETDATFMFDAESMMKMIRRYQQMKEVQPCTIADQIKYQIEHLGYIDYTNDKFDNHMVAVTALDTKYSPKFVAYNLKDGRTCEMRVSLRTDYRKANPPDTFQRKPFKNGDILRMNKCVRRAKQRKTDTGWEEVPGEYNWWIVKYDICNDIV